MSRKLIKSVYGSVAILKGYCKECKGYSFIIDGKFNCCNALVRDVYEKEQIKRESATEARRSFISYGTKKEILDLQENKCIYCGHGFDEYIWDDRKQVHVALKIHFDHFVPWISTGDNHKRNLYAACNICNLLKSDKHFHDLISAKEYICEKRKKNGLL